MKKKKVVITLSIVGIFILSFIIYNYINTDGIIIASGKGEESVNSKTFSLMLETSAGSGEYQMSTETSWPGSGYMYNETLSSCENGSQLIWNEETNSVTLKANISDKCYLYFDIVPPDVTLATTNTGPGQASENITIYNTGYQYVEFPTWTAKVVNGTNQDDIIWMKSNNSSGTHTVTVRKSEHNNETGTYYVHIYKSSASWAATTIITSITLTF